MSVSDYISQIIKVQETGAATEHSYRSALQFLFDGIEKDVHALNEPKRVECGAPDFVIMRKDIPVGHCEAKDVGIDINPAALKGANKKQFNRYKKALPNLIYTNGLDFRFYKHGVFIYQISIGDFLLGIQPKPENYEALENQLKDFAAERLQTITSSKKLAEMMAGKAVLIKDILGRALLEDEKKDSELMGQYMAFKEQLIQDLTIAEFADIYAETVAYGMFAARLHDDTPQDFSRQEAMELLPKSNPFLRSLFAYIAGPDLDERIRWIIDELADIFQATDLQSLFDDFGSFTQRNDPFIHFYETFLSEYNPAKRKARGVWYTPEPVVNFIVRAVDDVLKTEFGLPMGLADTSKVTVDWDTGQKGTTKLGKLLKIGKNATIKKELHRVQILDPATGTGTFLAETIKHIAPQVKNVAEGMWSDYVEQDLIPRLHGFELLMASYAMCHMKLDMILGEMGYKPTANPPRLSVYLTNSLEEGEAANQTLPFAHWLAKEVKEANTIKRDMPIMCIMGNPPYSVSSSNKGHWINGIMADYKKNLNEKNIQPLSDDYIKFIRLSQFMIEKNGEGVLGFITNNSYLDGLIHRQMRAELLRCFDKIYIIDLHGSTKKREVCPDGSPDKNVFDIQQGVSILIAVKTNQGKKADGTPAKVFHTDIWGKRDFKNEALYKLHKKSDVFTELNPIEPHYFFVPFDLKKMASYQTGFFVADLMPQNNCGLTTARDKFLTNFIQSEAEFVKNDLENLDETTFRSKYEERQDSRDWLLSNAQSDAKFATVEPFLYRPFDIRFLPYTPHSKGVIQYPRHEIMKHLWKHDNLAFSIPKQAIEEPGGLVTKNMIGHKSFSAYNRNYCFPLYLYPDEQDFDQTRKINFDPDIHQSIIAAATDPKNKVLEQGPDEVAIFDYIYGVLHCPSYRETFREFLKIDFPRIPYPETPKLFWDISAKGGQLRALHLMEKTAIGDTPYPFSGEGDTIVDKPAYEAQNEQSGSVRINEGQYFEAVPLMAWEFWIGGYQPAQKWLKDRKGRQLSFEDIQHYQKIIKILCETDRIMKTIEMPLER